MTRRLTSRPPTRIFLRHLHGLINRFGLTTVAECVEYAEDAALLRADGIGYLQGYHLGRPTIGTHIVWGDRSEEHMTSPPGIAPSKIHLDPVPWHSVVG